MPNRRNTLSGHAVGTSQVAPVGYRYAQIINMAFVVINQFIHSMLPLVVKKAGTIVQ
jgi:hypothetical protein